jgi:methionyl-tRNA formyltransferase
MSPLHIAFMGTAELACASLAALGADPTFEVVGVVTQPDRPHGRDLKLQFSPVKEAALKAGLRVLQPQRARHETFLADLRELQPDLIVVVAYGQILPPAILELPRFGCLNVHASLLPRYRGAAPIQWALIEGEPETGVTLMKMDAGLDTGDMLAQERTPIRDDDNAQTLHHRLAVMGADLLVRTLPDYVTAKIPPRPQPAEGATYARKIVKEDGRVDWTCDARAIWNRVRAFTPWPGSFTFLPSEPRPLLLKVWQAQVEPGAAGPPGSVLRADRTGIIVACGQHGLRLLQVQREGGRRLSAPEFLAGTPIRVGVTLG